MAEITNTISNFLYRTYDFIPRPKSIYYTFLPPPPPPPPPPLAVSPAIIFYISSHPIIN